MPSFLNTALCPSSGLLTDLYELTMGAGYVQTHFAARATFELFVRNLPPHRNYLVAAGLEQALEFLENVHFDKEEIAYLQALPVFAHVRPEFFDYLNRFHFTGDVWALPEGTVFFPGEPILRVTAPIGEAQLVETSLLSTVHLQTVVASKAARLTSAAGGRPVVEFGSRRAHGIEAGLLAARAAFIGGCEGTSNAYAGFRFAIPIFGTQAHSWIMAHDDESDAFNNFLDVFPEQATLLVDTYDVRAAVEKIIAAGRKPHGIRLDSGEVLRDSVWVRQRLDGIGWTDVQIFVSGDLTEERIAALLAGGACVDSFGVGTALSTSSDSPSLGVIYKLVEVQFENRIRDVAKFSAEKETYPGRKQVFRFSTEEGVFSRDIIGLEDEVFPGAEPLLVQAMQDGRRLDVAYDSPAVTAKNAQSTFLAGRKRLPPRFLTLGSATPFPVRYSDRLERLSNQIRHTLVETFPAKWAGSSVDPVSPKTIFWAVDLQADFMQPEGKLYVPGAEKIIPNIKRLVEAARQSQILLVSSADAHGLDDLEFRQWPPHCLKGTPGASLIHDAYAPARLVIPNLNGFVLPDSLSAYQHIVLEKNTLDVFDNPNTDRFLARLTPTGSPSFHRDVEFVVFGVVTEHCVRYAVEGLLGRGHRVALIADAIQALDSAVGRQIVAEFQARGVRLLTADEALAQLTPPIARSA